MLLGSSLAWSLALPAATPAPSPVLNLESRVVLMAGDQTGGTGFKAKFGGRFCVISNARVFWGNSKFTLTDMKGQALAYSGVWLCRKVASDGESTLDLALYELKETPQDYFDLDAGPVEGISSGAAVSVYGNSTKSQVISRQKGRIMGIGPERIEISARFAADSSGSPVVLDASGKAVGVATCVAPEAYPAWLTKGVRAADSRYFATRMDTVKPEDFEKIDMATYGEEVATLAAAAQVNAAGIYAVNGLCYGAGLDPEKIDNRNLRFQIQEWEKEKTLANKDRRALVLESRVRGIQSALRFPDALKAAGVPVVLQYERSRRLYEKQQKINAAILERLKEVEKGFKSYAIEHKLL